MGGDEQLTVWGTEFFSDAREHEREREDHENQPAEHVVHEQDPGDRKPRQVLGDETQQDDCRRKAAMANDEVRQNGHAGQARPPDPGIAEV